MFLSIVIPHYNLPQELLKRCIDSILATGIPADDYEIIVADDGSTDVPRWITATYTANNLKLIENSHSGQGAARNSGIDAAQGEYIQFVDADDTLQPNNAIEQCLDMLKKEHPDILRYRHSTTTMPASTTQRTTQKVHFDNTISGAAYMADNNLPAGVWCYFIKKELLTKKNIRFTANIFHEDEEFSTITHYHAKTLINSDAQIYNYCIREGSTITSDSDDFVEKRLNDRMTVLSNLVTFRATATNSNSIQKRALQRKLTTLVVDAIVNYLRAGKSAKEIHTICTRQITPLMLYPIANGKYGWKFRLFRKLANSAIGLRLLRLAIPNNKPVNK